MARRAGSYTYTDEEGVEHKIPRPRGPRADIPIYNLDAMDQKDLEAFLRILNQIPMAVQRAEALFPMRPAGSLRTAQKLIAMAEIRLRCMQGWPSHWVMRYNQLYRQLPRWARWERRLDLAACVGKDGKVRKRPPRPKWLEEKGE